MPDTIITCKNFIEAVEKQLYGFNWVCPSGGDTCQYRHMLPAGYVIDREKGLKKGEASEDEGEKLTMEEEIEEQRAALPADGLTPVTLESFLAWKEAKAKKKAEELEAQIEE